MRHLGGNQLGYLRWYVRAWIRSVDASGWDIHFNFWYLVGWIDRFSIWCLLFWFLTGRRLIAVLLGTASAGLFLIKE
jgi:hypothetical protein